MSVGRSLSCYNFSAAYFVESKSKSLGGLPMP